MSLHHVTPWLHSIPLSQQCGVECWLKLEALQPSGSFKLRGLGLACERAVERGAQHLISSSGGNAGLAVAWAGRSLGIPVTVVVPQSTSERMRDLIGREGATVRVHGAVWDDAHAHAQSLTESVQGAYLHPFDDPDIWEGHATMITEISQQGPRPDLLVVAVGGGGLLCGIAQGLHAEGWAEVPILAVETHGAASLTRSVETDTRVTLDRIDTIALTLGAKQVCAEALEWTRRHDIETVCVDDQAALRGCVRFADDHRLLVEPACGAALSVVYDRHPTVLSAQRVAVIVCGGAGVTRQQLDQWQTDLT